MKGQPLISHDISYQPSTGKIFTDDYYEDENKNTALFVNSCLSGHDYPNTFYCSYVNLCYFWKTCVV